MKIRNWKLKIVILSAILTAAVFLYKPISAMTMKVVYDLRYTDGLVGYWSFNGPDMNWGVASSSIDRSGQGNNGAPTNMSTTTSPVPGKIGQALNFDGADDYVAVPNSASLNVDGTDELTISVWIKPNANPSSGVVGIVNKFNSGPICADGSMQAYHMALTTAGKIWTSVNSDTGEDNSYASNNALSLGAWHHVVFTAKDGANNYNVYIDGALDSTRTKTGTGIFGGSSDLRIGGGFAACEGDLSFNGTIDEVRIYNRALTAGEIANHYEKGAGGKSVKINKSFADKWTSGLVGYWTMDGQDTNWTTGAIIDRSGNSNTGTITNMSTTTSPVPGKVGQALYTNGSGGSVGNGYISVPQSSSLGVTTGSIEMWANFASLQGDGRYLFSNNTDNLSIFYATALQFYYASGLTVNYAFTPVLNQWYHIAVTFTQSGNCIGYINGIQVASVACSNTPNNGAVSIGAQSNGARIFDGTLDEVRVYNRALTASEIQQQYQMSLGTKTNTPLTTSWTNGLVGFWSFNGPDMNWSVAASSLDRSGNNNNGTPTNMSTTTSPVPGKVGQALKFNGTNSYVSVPDSDLWAFGTADFSIEMWVNFSTVAVGSSLIGNDEGGGDKNKWTFIYGYPALGTITFPPNITGVGETQISFSWTPSANAWYHLVLTRSGTSFKFYVNAVQTGGTQTSSVSVPNAAAPLTIGTDGENYKWMNGTIDEVRIYNRALSAAEVLEHYQAAAGR